MNGFMTREEIAKETIGLKESEAFAYLAKNDLSWRIYERDGISFPLTAEFRPDRVNYAAENGIVIDAMIG